MTELDSKINKLVLKWASNIEGTWKDVIEDLKEFSLEILREHSLSPELADKQYERFDIQEG